MAYAGLKHWNARGGSIQARPGKPTMRITPWLFAFVSIHSACVKLIKQPLVLPRWSLGKETASRRATYPACSQVVCETDGKESNRDNDGERLYTSKWMHQNSVSAGVVYLECFYYYHYLLMLLLFSPTIGTIEKSQRRLRFILIIVIFSIGNIKKRTTRLNHRLCIKWW